MRPLIVLALLAAASQSTFRSGVDLVQVDVSVLDKQRHPVRGLTAADFTLLEDGKPRPIAAFSAVELPGRVETGEAPWMRDVPPDVATNAMPEEGRLVVILMDRTIPDGFPALNAREIAKAAVRELGGGDLAAVVYTGGGTPQDFTNDRAALFAAIEGSSEAAELSEGANDIWAGLLAALENPAVLLNPNPGLAALNLSSECLCGACVLDAIGRVADAVREAPRRRKSLLFIGRDIQVETTESICIDPVRKARDAMFKSLDLASLTVHALDPGGLETLSFAARGRAGGYRGRANLVRQGNISVLPDRTGGRTVLNTNNPVARVPEIFSESDSYYLLGFQPAMVDGKRHNISVKVSRRGVDVRTLSGYLADAPAVAVAEPAVAGGSASAAIGGIMPSHDGVSLSAHASAFAAPPTREPVLAIALHVEHDAPAGAPPAARSESVEVVTGVFTTTGRAIGTLRQTLSVTPRQIAGGPVTYDVLQRIAAKPGRYELRIGLHNPTRRQTGSVYTSIDVPDFRKARFAVGDVEIYVPPGSPAMAESLSDVLPAPPTARRVFDRGEHATAFLPVYQASPPAPVAISTRIVDEHNRQQYGQETSIDVSSFKAGRADYTADLPLVDLASGSYLLTIEAKTALNAERRDVRFSVK